MRRGLSLVEIVVAVGFLAISLILVLSLMPAGILSLDQAEKLETGTLLGTMLVDEANAPGGTETIRYTLNGTEYTCLRSYTNVSDELFDVHVRVEWRNARVPLEFWLRKDRRT
jgi:hypothetical protein